MKPLRLVLQAFGPYAGREVLDFQVLPRNALFLVHGPTGAGKSTVLDGLCYALYGEAAGEDRDPEDVRSHHADAGLVTEVELDFALGPARFRVRRRPRQMRPKKSGEGFTSQGTSAEFYRLGDRDAEVEVLATGVREVTDEVQRRLGFASRQFRQVVVLPQGRFRELLVASSKEREPILEALFQTARYLRVQRSLGERAAALRREVEETEARLDEMRTTAAETLGLAEGTARALDDLRAGWRARDEALAALRDEAQMARTREEAARWAHAAGRKAQETLGELTASQRAVVVLASQEPQVGAWREQVEAARRGEPLAGAVEARDVAARRRALAEEARAAAEGAKSQAVQAAAAASAALAAAEAPVAREERERAAEAVRELQGLRPKAEALSRAREEHAQAGAECERAARVDARAVAASQQADVALESVRTKRDDARLAAAGLEAARARVESLQGVQRRLGAWIDARREGETRTAQHARAERDLVEQGAAQQRAERDAEQARHRYVTAQAAVLAHSLEDGAPCPVCGSLEHPAPADAETEPPGEDELERLEATAREGRETLSSLRERVARLAAERSAATATVARLAAELGTATATDAKALAAQIASALASQVEAQTAADGVGGLEQAVVAAEARHAQAREAAAHARESLQAARVTQGAQAKALHLAEAQVPEVLREPQALAEALRKAARRHAALDAGLEEARKRAASAREALATDSARFAETDKAAQAALRDDEEQAASLARRLAVAAFADVAAWRAARLAREDLTALERAVAAHEGEVAAADDRLRRARDAAKGVEAPALEALQAAVEDAEVAARTGAARAEVLADNVKRAAGQIERLATTQERGRALEARYRLLQHLAQVATGHNPENLSFQRYVLAALLDEVLEVASRRLADMTKGRYRLRRRREVADARSAAGLDLDVDDAWTGQARKASTLSGGESFLAALALALATAEVVQRHAGGTRLDAMFIDEGFGGLDPEALEEAMRTLVGLQQGGRMVGVISHVPELREWIDVRLCVEAGRNGSHARFMLP